MSALYMCLVALIFLLITSITSAFSGNFELTSLVVASPFQADPYSTESTHIECKLLTQFHTEADRLQSTSATKTHLRSIPHTATLSGQLG